MSMSVGHSARWIVPKSPMGGYGRHQSSGRGDAMVEEVVVGRQLLVTIRTIDRTIRYRTIVLK